MIVRTNTQSFDKQMNNIVQYAFGFLDGVQKGMSDVEVGHFLIESLILVHCANFHDKF